MAKSNDVAKRSAIKPSAKGGKGRQRKPGGRHARTEGPVLSFEFDPLLDGMLLSEFGSVFANLYSMAEELVEGPRQYSMTEQLAEDSRQDLSAAAHPPGLYVTSIGFRSPLRVNITFFKIKKGAVQAFHHILEYVLFYRQTGKLKDAEADIRRERARQLLLDNIRQSIAIAREVKEAGPDVEARVSELMRISEELASSPLRLEQVRFRPHLGRRRRRR